jgi:hypothetical protein
MKPSSSLLISSCLTVACGPSIRPSTSLQTGIYTVRRNEGAPAAGQSTYNCGAVGPLLESNRYAVFVAEDDLVVFAPSPLGGTPERHALIRESEESAWYAESSSPPEGCKEGSGPTAMERLDLLVLAEQLSADHLELALEESWQIAWCEPENGDQSPIECDFTFDFSYELDEACESPCELRFADSLDPKCLCRP